MMAEVKKLPHANWIAARIHDCYYNILIQDSSREDRERQNFILDTIVILVKRQDWPVLEFVSVEVGLVARLFARHMYFTLLHKSKTGLHIFMT